MDLWIEWIYGSGSMDLDLDLWIWIYGSGSMDLDLDLWIWIYGSGSTMDLT
jgi:hypothetical protein